jgi:hypothetical protein
MTQNANQVSHARARRMDRHSMAFRPDSMTTHLKQWIGIAIIGIVVFRLWDIPLLSVAGYVTGGIAEGSIQFLAVCTIQVILGAYRAFRRRRGDPPVAAPPARLNVSGSR